MPKPKSLCPSCCTHTVTFTSDNCDYFAAIKIEYRKQGKRITIEKLVNKIINEHRFLKDTKGVMV